jgi:DNA-directed RNA polymerase sigma subunit (sigma70/sigma32)
VLGFAHAIDKFRIDGGACLLSYGAYWCRAAMNNCVHDAQLVRVPRSTSEKIKRGEHVRATTAAALSHLPKLVPLPRIDPNYQDANLLFADARMDGLIS